MAKNKVTCRSSYIAIRYKCPCEWARINKMTFHPDKCKILLVNNFHKNFLQELYNVIFDYTDEEKDLGILTTTKFNFKAHQTFILNKALTQFNILGRTCHFVNNSKYCRTLYLTLVRSLFKPLFRNLVSKWTGCSSL